MAELRGLLVLALLLLAGASHAKPELRFSIAEGRIQNEFYRDGPIAAHLVIRSGERARLVVAFPAGNSGAGLWFEEATDWKVSPTIQGHIAPLADGSFRRGIISQLESSARSLTIRRALLGSVRTLRDYGYANPISFQVEAVPTIKGNRVIWERRRIDGAPGYYQSLEILNGRAEIDANGLVRLSSKEPVKLRFTALTGDQPLTPIPASALLKPGVNSDQQLHNALAFLSYDEKLLAGSWQYNTYFGRDTLMSLRLLMSVLKPRAIEAGLSSVLIRLNANGEVAHEEDIGEFALLACSNDREKRCDDAIFDYKMVDDDFMAAPVIAHYLLETREGRARAREFLGRKAPDGSAYGTLLVRNLDYVIRRAQPFAREPVFTHLIGLNEGLTVGQWRDSLYGLGGDGLYPYDINVALVPAALEAAALLYASGLLDPYSQQRPVDLKSMAAVWQRKAAPMFKVVIERKDVKPRLGRFIDALPEATVADAGAIRFDALALDSLGKPIPVMHSDIGYDLLFNRPDNRRLAAAVSDIMKPFPTGLLSPVGMFVANPAYAAPQRHAIFDRTRYHGTLVWSWQQAMMLAGIERQLLRGDLTKANRELLVDARAKLQSAVIGHAALRGSELWSWTTESGRMVAVPFGQGIGDETESNAIQLWSMAALGRWSE